MADPFRSEPGNSGGPPPPPPPMMGVVPAKRLPSEISEKSNEPPLCVQNAMLTKDKKPFTYTPGGIDLSQIRSPRMARRIVRNAQSEGVTDTPKPSPLVVSSELLPPSALAAMQPQMPFQVFPNNPQGPRKVPSKTPPPPPILMRPSRLQKQPTSGPQDVPEVPVRTCSQNPLYSSEPLQVSVKGNTPVTPPTPYTPQSPQAPQLLPKPQISKKPQVPPPFFRQHNPNIPQTENTPQPPQTPPTPTGRHSPPRTSADRDIGSLVIPSVQQMPKLQSPPIPWMHQGSRSAHQEVVPPWVNRDENDEATVRPSSTRVVPIQTAGRQNSQPSTPQIQESNKSGVRIVPMKVEGSDKSTPVQEMQERSNQPSSGWGKNNSATPTQSRSFRVLQQTTEGYDELKPKTRIVPIEYERPPAEQLRKLQLAEDDKMLMNQFKAQVDDETYLHTEEEPRFRGAAIPSKAFRVLQTMTGTEGDVRLDEEAKPQQRPVKQVRSGVEPTSSKPYIPPSEQKAPEPRKYTGCNIPGRSFKILQAITEPENYGPGQSDL